MPALGSGQVELREAPQMIDAIMLIAAGKFASGLLPPCLGCRRKSRRRLNFYS